MARTIVTDYTTRPVVPFEAATLVGLLQTALASNRADEDKAGDVGDASYYEGQANMAEHTLRWLTEGDFREHQYVQCGGLIGGERCWFFVEYNTSHTRSDDGIAPWVHLTRGDDADESTAEQHEARPSNDVHGLSWWKANGPDNMKARFTS